MKIRLGILICAAWLTSTFVLAAETPQLPRPSGPYGIGRVGYDWIDASRSDPLAAAPNTPRELMVYLWYPTEKSSKDARGVYLPGAKQIEANAELGREMREGYGATWSQIVSGAIASHAVEDAPPAKNPKQFPVVLFSHGQGGSVFGYTALIESLVSRGYVVAALQHPGTADVVVFPDGRLVLQHHDTPPEGLSQAQRFQRMMEQASLGIEVGAADQLFVLDRLIKENASDAKHFPLAGRLDLNCVTAMGHSAGAEFAARACQLDARFKACVDLDGAMAPVAALPEYPDGKTIQQPLLFLEAYHDEAHIFGAPEQKLAFSKKEKEQLEKCPAGSYRVVLNPPGMMHGSFSDDFVLRAENTPEQTAQALHNLALADSYILAFLDKNLKHLPAPLLDDLKAPHPEATIQPLGKFGK
jgi:Platelet-activating factor acetylhydrolase, isoform II